MTEPARGTLADVEATGRRLAREEEAFRTDERRHNQLLGWHAAISAAIKAQCHWCAKSDRPHRYCQAWKIKALRPPRQLRETSPDVRPTTQRKDRQAATGVRGRLSKHKRGTR